jgi:nucleoside-diphosphate-sugar epimerase
MFGPGDTSVLPRIIGALERGAFPLIGDGTQLVELTWIGNAVDAVERALVVPGVEGRVYHVTNGEPRPLVDLLDRLCARLDLPRPRRRVPYRVAYAAAAATERLHRAVPRLGEPTLTRYGVTVVGLTSTLDISALRRDLGWSPAVSLDEGIDRFCTWWASR